MGKKTKSKTNWIKRKQMAIESQIQSYQNIKQKWPQNSNLKPQIVTLDKNYATYKRDSVV